MTPEFEVQAKPKNLESEDHLALSLALSPSAYYGDVDSAQAAWENNDQGQYENEIDFAIQLFEELYMAFIPEIAQGYIDYASFRRDIFIDDYYSIIVADKAHIFSL